MAYATPDDFNRYYTLSLDLTDAALVAQVTSILASASATVDAHLAAAGVIGTQVTAAWAVEFVKLLTVVFAGVAFTMPYGPQMDAATKQMWLNWLEAQYAAIQSGQIDLTGQSGSGWPAFGTIEHNLTGWSAGQIMARRLARTGV